MKLKNNALQELYDMLVSGNPTISPYAESPIEKAFRECDEKIQKDNDFWKCGNEILHSANMDLVNYKKKLEKEIENLQSRAHYAEDEVERLRKAHDELFNAGSRKISELRRENEAVNKKLEKEIEELKKKIQLLEDDLKSKACSRDAWRIEAERLRKKLTESYSNGYSDGKEEGEENLWDALQNVRDVNLLEEFDPECETLGDIIDMDLEDFLDTYKKWQEEKEKERLDHMRDYLARFCEGRVCKGCPLESTEYKCGCGHSFRRRDRFDTRIIPDEELERYYEKARGGSGKIFVHDPSHPMEGVNEAIKNACEKFTKAVEAANINISTRAWHGDATAEKIKIEPWSCTLEGTINVEFDRDLLEKVCGVKPEEKEEHKLEYGDAVRVPWRDYDYMYIGPDKRGDGKMIRLFDPKSHSVSYVSSNEHLDIRGYKIIIGNEEDLRKIWCDKDADKE